MSGSIRWATIGLALAAITGCVSGTVQQTDPKTYYKQRPPKAEDQRRKIAVADFEDKSGYGKEQVGRPAGDILSTVLVDCEQFAVYERQKLSAALDELKLGQSGVIDPTTAARAGKMIGVDFVMYGTVSKAAFRVEHTNVVLYQSKKQVAEVTVDCRMVHVESGRIVFAKEGNGLADRAATGALGMGGGMSYDSGLFADALRAAIYKMMDDMIDKAEMAGR
ncbi:MAG TPA: CsgG/HfaB family protein [Planctomycetota bacterium]|nr:CsgG/HfaB family protein [Planctomycetota bacterium]